VPLFIDSLPLDDPYPGSPASTWYALLPVIVTEAGVDLCHDLNQCRPWKLDTGNALEASAWRFHLLRAGVDPDQELQPDPISVRSAGDQPDELPIRKASLWLVSNIPSLRASPFRIELDQGVAFYDREPRRRAGKYPLLGMRALRRAGLRVFIDGAQGTISVWVPGRWLQAAGRWLRRLPGRFATSPLDELCPTPWW
jgi:hypothetical protein